jgi:hypothetical protein
MSCANIEGIASLEKELVSLEKITLATVKKEISNPKTRIRKIDGLTLNSIALTLVLII